MSIVSIFSASPTISTIVSIPSIQIISIKVVETKPQLSTKFLNKGKEKEEEIDLDEEIIILNWDISNFNPNQMHIIGEPLHKKSDYVVHVSDKYDDDEDCSSSHRLTSSFFE